MRKRKVELRHITISNAENEIITVNAQPDMALAEKHRASSKTQIDLECFPHEFERGTKSGVRPTV
jgi:hypothetical protein